MELNQEYGKYNRNIYYIDASVLLENIQLRIFHTLNSEDIDDVISRFLHWIYIMKRKLHGGLNIWILSSRVVFIVSYCFHHSKIKSVYIRIYSHILCLFFACLTTASRRLRWQGYCSCRTESLGKTWLARRERYVRLRRFAWVGLAQLTITGMISITKIFPRPQNEISINFRMLLHLN